MKNSVILSISILASFFAAPLLAQPVSVPITYKDVVAFVKADRSELWIKRPDTAAYRMLKADPSANNRTSFKKIEKLALLDQTDDGGTLLLGGSFTFYSLWGEN